MMTRKMGGICLLAVAAALAVFTQTGCVGVKHGPTPPPPPVVAPSAVLVFPGTTSVPVNGMAQFTAFLPGKPSATFTWSVSGGGTISATGLYTAPAAVPNPANVTITATDSSSSATGTATGNITAAQGVAVSPAAIAVPAGMTQLFSATVAGNPVTPTWQVNGVAGGDSIHGTIAANGTYTAPPTPPPGSTTTITAISGANSGTATVAVVFSNRSLSGRYAFSYAGKDSSGALAVAGSFTATSATAAISGIEDYNSKKLASPSQAGGISGTYTVNPDGSGSATVTNALISATETWQFALTSSPGAAAGQGWLIRFDTGATGSGTLEQQDPTQLVLSAFAQNYVFSLAGLDASKKPLQIAGKFQADGLGTIPVNSGVEDINDAGTNTQTAPDRSLFGDYAMDAAHPSSGRGTLHLTNSSTQLPGTFTFSFYIVNGAHLKIVETDTSQFLAGDAFSAPNTNGSFSNSLLNGEYAFTLGGSNVQQSLPFAAGGVFVANGNGGVTSGVLDTNEGGVTVQLNQALTSSSYSVDSNLGRIGSFTLVAGTTTYNFAAYAASSGAVEIIELDSQIVAGGLALPQSSTVQPQGSFAVNFTGLGNSSGYFPQDVAGQMTAGAGGAVSGSLYINSNGALTSGAAFVSGTTIGTPASNGRGTATVKTSAFSFPVAYYTVDGNTVLMVETDSARVLTGALAKQF
jgi:hypothetical protein